MKRDIFNTLKHNNHDLKVIQEGDNILLGCKTCGETLYSISSNIKLEYSTEITRELVDAYNACVREEALNSADKIKELIIEISGIKQLVTEVLNDVHGDERAVVEYSMYNFSADKLRDNLYKLDINFESVFETELNKQINKNYPHIKIFTKDDAPIIVSNKKYIYGTQRYNLIELINRDRIIELESDNPTVKDTLVINNKEELRSIFPSWDNEENEDDNYYEFVYRLENNLIDFSNLTKEEKEDILKNYLMNDVLDNYDCIQSYKHLVRVLLKTFNINI